MVMVTFLTLVGGEALSGDVKRDRKEDKNPERWMIWRGRRRVWQGVESRSDGKEEGRMRERRAELHPSMI